MYGYVLRYSEPVYGKSALIYGVQSARRRWCEGTLPFMDNEPRSIEVSQAVPRLMAHHLKSRRRGVRLCSDSGAAVKGSPVWAQWELEHSEGRPTYRPMCPEVPQSKLGPKMLALNCEGQTAKKRQDPGVWFRLPRPVSLATAHARAVDGRGLSEWSTGTARVDTAVPKPKERKTGKNGKDGQMLSLTHENNRPNSAHCSSALSQQDQNPVRVPDICELHVEKRNGAEDTAQNSKGKSRKPRRDASVATHDLRIRPAKRHPRPSPRSETSAEPLAPNTQQNRQILFNPAPQNPSTKKRTKRSPLTHERSAQFHCSARPGRRPKNPRSVGVPSCAKSRVVIMEEEVALEVVEPGPRRNGGERRGRVDGDSVHDRRGQIKTSAGANGKKNSVRQAQVRAKTQVKEDEVKAHRLRFIYAPQRPGTRQRPVTQRTLRTRVLHRAPKMEEGGHGTDGLPPLASLPRRRAMYASRIAVHAARDALAEHHEPDVGCGVGR
ncbi:hypothetical protein C8F04DRAFT_1241704 [Mycena alexandri]|uniref:Uncharacterized protein n=1 Tax=Mycena alexandri TaxID=1745969 RepID=A0AAD6S6T8_9AGAR|nr:hypothetical protein C8F04DRAFT_1241704 [Mycena alexandri]